MTRVLDSEQLDLAQFLRPGDGVVVGQACAEPTVLVDALLTQAASIGPLQLFAGLTWREEIAQRKPATLTVVSYGGLGRTGRIPGVQVVPCHFSQLPALFADRRLPGDVALVQVAPPDAQGRCSLGAGVDYILDALTHARVVIAEVNDHCPASTGAWIEWRQIDVAVRTSRPLLEAPNTEPGETERRIASHVAALVRDGDTIQIGVGALPNAILTALRDRSALGVHSGMITDGVLDLIETGVVTGEHKPVDRGLCVTGAALGSRRLFDALADNAEIVMRPIGYTHAPVTLARVGRLCAINSALEVSLDGEVGSESAGGRTLGAVGGQVDFLRAAGFGGTPVIALPAKRIVERLSGPVSTTRADVDWVVTEHGARSLRGLDPKRTAEALIEIAGPQAGDRSHPVAA